MNLRNSMALNKQIPKLGSSLTNPTALLHSPFPQTRSLLAVRKPEPSMVRPWKHEWTPGCLPISCAGEGAFVMVVGVSCSCLLPTPGEVGYFRVTFLCGCHRYTLRANPPNQVALEITGLLFLGFSSQRFVGLCILHSLLY